MQTEGYRRIDGRERQWCGMTFQTVGRVWEEREWKRTMERNLIGGFFFMAGGLSHALAYSLSKSHGENMSYAAYGLKSLAIPFCVWAMASSQRIDRDNARHFTKEVLLDICTALCIETIVAVGREMTEGSKGFMIAAEVISTITVSLLFHKTYKRYTPHDLWLF